MAHIQYGDELNFDNVVDAFTIRSIEDVLPIRFDTIRESWVVCEQGKATHMMIKVADDNHERYMFVEIGKCDNIYLLADAIVD